MAHLVRVVRGKWVKREDGVWFHEPDYDAYHCSIFLKERVTYEEVVVALKEKIRVREGERFEITYQWPHWMLGPDWMKTDPIQIKDDEDDVLFMAIRSDLDEVFLRVQVVQHTLDSPKRVLEGSGFYIGESSKGDGGGLVDLLRGDVGRGEDGGVPTNNDTSDPSDQVVPFVAKLAVVSNYFAAGRAQIEQVEGRGKDLDLNLAGNYFINLHSPRTVCRTPSPSSGFSYTTASTAYATSGDFNFDISGDKSTSTKDSSSEPMVYPPLCPEHVLQLPTSLNPMVEHWNKGKAVMVEGNNVNAPSNSRYTLPTIPETRTVGGELLQHGNKGKAARVEGNNVTGPSISRYTLPTISEIGTCAPEAIDPNTHISPIVENRITPALHARDAPPYFDDPIVEDDLESALRDADYEGDEIFIGRIFRSKEDCRLKLAIHAINRKFHFRYAKSCNNIVIVVCVGDGCPWRVYTTKMDDNTCFEVRRATQNHTCSVDARGNFHRCASTAVIGDMMRNRYTVGGRGPRTSELRRILMQEYSLHVSYWKAWRARQLLL